MMGNNTWIFHNSNNMKVSEHHEVRILADLSGKYYGY